PRPPPRRVHEPRHLEPRHAKARSPPGRDEREDGLLLHTLRGRPHLQRERRAQERYRPAARARAPHRRRGRLRAEREEGARAARGRAAGGDRDRRQRQAWDRARRGPPPPRDLAPREDDRPRAQNREARPSFEAWLRGKIAYVMMVDRAKGSALLEALGRVPKREPP